MQTGRKWGAGQALDVAESRLRQKALLGSIAAGHAGIGYFPSNRIDQAQGKERQHVTKEEVRASMEEGQTSRIVGMGRQRAWTKWEMFCNEKSPGSTSGKQTFNIKFFVQAVYNVLPSPANLHVWGKTETPSCPHCPGWGSMKHLLSSCPEALGDGHYCWHHDQVLKAVAESIAIAINASQSHHRTKTIMFHRAGEKPNVPPQTKAGLLTSLNDWQLEVDLGRQLKFPQDCTNQATTRHDHYLRFHQATDHSGAYRAMGGTYEGGQREEVCQVPGAGGRVLAARLEDVL